MICYRIAVNWDAPEIQAIVRSALHEDSARGDLTTRILIDPAWRIDAAIVAKQRGIIAGLAAGGEIPEGPRPLDPVPATGRRRDPRPPGSGSGHSERKGSLGPLGGAPGLNALQHLSGIATFTHKQLRKLKGTGAHLYDTRKTLPGWRFLQKYAVRCGGGINHRMSLGDAVLIKENHLEIARMAGSDWVARVQHAMKKHRKFLQMEVQTERDLRDALRLKPQRVLLDNLEPHDLKRMMRILKKAIPGIEIEFTGGIKPADLRPLAKLRPDRISMGRLTHSTPAFDCSLDITHVYTR